MRSARKSQFWVDFFGSQPCIKLIGFGQTTNLESIWASKRVRLLLSQNLVNSPRETNHCLVRFKKFFSFTHMVCLFVVWGQIKALHGNCWHCCLRFTFHSFVKICRSQQFWGKTRHFFWVILFVSPPRKAHLAFGYLWNSRFMVPFHGFTLPKEHMTYFFADRTSAGSFWSRC